METVRTDVTIVGGGIAGITSALAMANMGYTIVLVEKESALGGHAAQWACMATDTCAKCSACTIERDLEAVRNHPYIKIFTQVEIVNFTGSKGAFSLTLIIHNDKKGQSFTGRTDTEVNQMVISSSEVLLTLGFKEFDATRKVMLSYKRIPEVITIKDVDDAMKKDRLCTILPDPDGKGRFAFIMCVGSRDRMNGNDYCSQFCGKTSVRLINRLKYLKPEYVFDMYYIDLQIMCKDFCSFYSTMQETVTFYQGLPAEVLDGPEKGTVKLFAVNKKTGNFEERIYDRVVLAIGMSPHEDSNRLSKLFGIPLNEFGYLKHSHDNGAYCTSREGIYLAGACAGPTDINGSRMQALSAVHHIVSDLKEIASGEQPVEVSREESGAVCKR
ncbi:MAG: FAD-dependent oxidoreductase [Chitinispirillia bacterium]|jgi:heterodisulfide reductase subunit A